MANRLNLKEIIPDTHQIFMQLSQAVANTRIDKLHQELIKIRASPNPTTQDIFDTLLPVKI
jgi:hypothetical protein